MKKRIISIVLLVLACVMPFVSVSAATTTTKKTSSTTTTTTTTTEEKQEEKIVSVHVFYSKTCGFCSRLHEFLDALSKDETYGKMFKVVDYEVSESNNGQLYQDVAAYFNQKYDGSVPAYVIGDEYFNGYASESYDDKIKAAIKKAYEDKKYVDKVAKVIDGTAYNNNNIVGYIILASVVVIVVAVIISSSKNKYYEDDEEDNTEEETKKEETSTTTKKTTTKKKANSTKKKASSAKKSK